MSDTPITKAAFESALQLQRDGGTGALPKLAADMAQLESRLAACEAALAATKHHWCAYCNFGDETKQSLEDLQGHIKICPYHPMRKLEAALIVAREMGIGLDLRKYNFAEPECVEWGLLILSRFTEAMKGIE